MAEIWGAAIAVGGSIISGIAASKKAKQDRANAKEDNKEMTEREARFHALLSQFDAEQADYYNQLNRQRKQRGLEQFRQFSTVNQFAPNFSGGNNPIELPTRPNADTMFTEQQAAQPAVATQDKKSNSSKITLLTGDPILGKLFG